MAMLTDRANIHLREQISLSFRYHPLSREAVVISHRLRKRPATSSFCRNLIAVVTVSSPLVHAASAAVQVVDLVRDLRMLGAMTDSGIVNLHGGMEYLPRLLCLSSRVHACRETITIHLVWLARLREGGTGTMSGRIEGDELRLWDLRPSLFIHCGADPRTLGGSYLLIYRKFLPPCLHPKDDCLRGNLDFLLRRWENPPCHQSPVPRHASRRNRLHSLMLLLPLSRLLSRNHHHSCPPRNWMRCGRI